MIKKQNVRLHRFSHPARDAPNSARDAPHPARGAPRTVRDAQARCSDRALLDRGKSLFIYLFIFVLLDLL